MTTPLGFEALQGILQQRIDRLPDHAEQAVVFADVMSLLAIYDSYVLTGPSRAAGISRLRRRMPANRKSNRSTRSGTDRRRQSWPRIYAAVRIRSAAADGGILATPAQ